MKLKNYLINNNYKQLEKIIESFNIPVEENLGDSVKRTLLKKKNEIIKALEFIKSLSLKTVNLSKDNNRIKKLDVEIKQAEKELEDILNQVSDVLDFMFDGT